MAFDLSSIAEDLLEKAEEWMSDMLTAGITKEFDIISGILNLVSEEIRGRGTPGSPDFNANVRGARSFAIYNLLSTNPENWSGLWTTVKGATEGVIVPVAGTLFGVLMVVEFIRILVGKNNFNDFDGSEILRWILKYYAGNELLANAYVIAPWLLGIGVGITAKFTGTSFGSLSVTDLETTLAAYDSAELLLVFLVMLVILLGVAGLVIVLIASLCTRMIEAVMYMSVAPVTTATFFSDDFSSIGKSWTKGLIGIGFQGLLIMVAIIAEGSLLSSSISAIQSAGGSDLIFNLVVLLGMTGGLTMTVAKSGQLSKQIFGA